MKQRAGFLNCEPIFANKNPMFVGFFSGLNCYFSLSRSFAGSGLIGIHHELIESFGRPGQRWLEKMLIDGVGIDPNFILGIAGHPQTQKLHQVMGINFGDPGVVHAETRQE